MKYLNKILTSFLLLFGSASFATEDTVHVFQFGISEEINARSWEITHEALKQAREMECDLIVVKINTYGGRLDFADSIRSRFLKSEIPLYSFINNNAASAGALISLSTEKIYMTQEATIGAASVVNQSGEIMPEKNQSYMRAMMRATAEKRGHDPKIAEAMVDPDIEIEGITEEGKVLTLTAKEALESGISEATVESLEEIFNQNDMKVYKVSNLSFSPAKKIELFFLNPFVASIIIMMIFGGIYFELQTPGIGFAGLIALIGVIAYFVPLYIEDLASNYEILMFFAGLSLIIIEVFVIPGFGIAGVLGLILMLLGLSLSTFADFSFDEIEIGIINEILLKMGYFLLLILVTLVLSVIVSYKFFTSRFFETRLSLSKKLSKEEGYTSQVETMNDLLEKKGIAKTDLRPSGIALIDGKSHDAISKDGFIEKGEKLKVISQEATQIYVERDEA